MNSPWAMLITPIWPKIIARPIAMRTNTENRDKPANPCMAKMDINSVEE